MAGTFGILAKWFRIPPSELWNMKIPEINWWLKVYEEQVRELRRQ